MSYGVGSHRMQLNGQLSTSEYPRFVNRDFIDFVEGAPVESLESEQITMKKAVGNLGETMSTAFPVARDWHSSCRE